MARRKALVEPDAMAAMPTREGAKRSGPSRETQLLGGGGPPALFVRPRKPPRLTLTLSTRILTKQRFWAPVVHAIAVQRPTNPIGPPCAMKTKLPKPKVPT